MIFTQLNDGAAQRLGDSDEIDVLQEMACSIGPPVDGMRVAMALPQAMGAFVTAGAQGACGGRSHQQQEQHTPTTVTRGDLGAARMTMPNELVKPSQAASPTPVIATMTEMPTMPMATTHPVGTIAAFSAKHNMWRIAFPHGNGYLEQAPVMSPEMGDTQMSESEFEAKLGKPFYKKPLFWAVLGGSVAVLGGGSYLYMRRHRKAGW